MLTLQASLSSPNLTALTGLAQEGPILVSRKS